MIDDYGRTVSIATSNGQDVYTVTDNGITVLTISVASGPLSQAALSAINANAPPSFSPAKTRFAPYVFLNLFTDAEKSAIVNSNDPIVKTAITDLTAIITYVDVTDQKTISLVGYLVSVGLITSDRAPQILAGAAHV